MQLAPTVLPDAAAGRAPSTFGRARRRRAYRSLARGLGARRDELRLLPLDEAERRLRPFNRHYVGVRAIPIDRIVGTDGRGSDFDRAFLPRRPGIAQRWRNVERAFPDGDFPPIVVRKLGEAYFVLDGHHRVAIARQRGMTTIDADVSELVARWPLAADADLVDLVHAEQERLFVDQSGIPEPAAPIRFSHPSGYVELLENVEIHGYHLMLESGRVLTRDEIGRDWYERIYAPAAIAIESARLGEAYPDATTADLFLHVYRERRRRVPDRGCSPLELLAHELADEHRQRRRLGRLLKGAERRS
jgi:ParB-like nuclease domain